jgi:hypothetical protein
MNQKVTVMLIVPTRICVYMVTFKNLPIPSYFLLLSSFQKQIL